MIMSKPKIHLQKIGQYLGPTHELAIPGPEALSIQKLPQCLFIDQRKQRSILLPKDPVHSGLKDGFVLGIEGLGIGALFPVRYALRQDISHGCPKEALFFPPVVFVFPGNGIELLGDPIVTKWYPNFQAPIHAHSVLSVQQGLHKPAEIQVDHFFHPSFLRTGFRKDIAFQTGFPVSIHNKFFWIQSV